jgi:hypothetical protein
VYQPRRAGARLRDRSSLTSVPSLCFRTRYPTLHRYGLFGSWRICWIVGLYDAEDYDFSLTRGSVRAAHRLFVHKQAGAGIEPANSGFADRDLTTWLPRQLCESGQYRCSGACIKRPP